MPRRSYLHSSVIPWRGLRWFTQYQFGVNIVPVPLFRCHPLAGIEVVHTHLENNGYRVNARLKLLSSPGGDCGGSHPQEIVPVDHRPGEGLSSPGGD